MTSGLLMTGWIVVTLLYIAMHHGYNWLARKIDIDDEDDFGLQVILGIIYLVVNVVYFKFTYDIFITIASLS
jgi:hypothetical protein